MFVYVLVPKDAKHASAHVQVPDYPDYLGRDGWYEHALEIILI